MLQARMEVGHQIFSGWQMQTVRNLQKNVSMCSIAVIHIQLYTFTCGNIINHNDERTQFFRKIYLSYFIRGLCVRGELETEQTATYWPPLPLSLAAFLSRSAGLFNRGSWGPIVLCWVLVLSTASYLQLTELLVAPGYIIVWCPPASCECRICTQFNPSTVKVIPWYLRPDGPVLWLTAGSKVNMLHMEKYVSVRKCFEMNKTSVCHHEIQSRIQPYSATNEKFQAQSLIKKFMKEPITIDFLEKGASVNHTSLGKFDLIDFEYIYIYIYIYI